MIQLYDPSVSGLPQDDDGYMGDAVIDIDAGYADSYPEWVAFQALEYMNYRFSDFFFYVSNWEIMNDKGGQEELYWRFATIIVEMRTCLLVLQESVPDVRTIDDVCLRLWPDQPPTTPMDDLQATAIMECYDTADRLIRLTIHCCEEAKTLAANIRTMNVRDVMNVTRHIPMKLLHTGVVGMFGTDVGGDGIDWMFTEQMRVGMQVEMILTRLRSLYMIDKYGCSNPLIPQQQRNGKVGLSDALNDLVVDMEARTVTWKDSPIPGLNGHSHFDLIRILHEHQGGIVSNAELHNAIKGHDPLTVNGGKSTAATPELMNTTSQVKHLFRKAGVSIEIKNYRLIGYKFS